jgi:hypothetical protein
MQPACAEESAGGGEAGSGEKGLEVSAYLDASYNHLSGDGQFVSGAPDRVFDTRADGTAIQQAAVIAAYQPKEGWGGLVNATLGNDADVISSYGTPNRARADLTQAAVQYGSQGFTLMAGKFATLAGAEVIPSPANWNFSRGILFGYAIPFTHTGLRGTYAPSDSLTVYLGVNNGWDDFKDTNTSKTLELGTVLTPNKTFNVAAYGYFGVERVGGLVGTGPQGQRALVDVVATWTVSESLTLVANYDWGRQGNALPAPGGLHSAAWSGLAGYVNYVLAEHWKASLRSEYFDDGDGYRTGVAQDWRETTATLAYLPHKRIEIRAELRRDTSDVEAFQRVSGVPSAGQTSIGLQLLLKY